MPARLFNSAQIEELWGIPQAEYQKLCRARHIDHLKMGKPNAVRPRYMSTAAQVDKYLTRRLVRAR